MAQFSVTPPSTNTCHFFRLPGELRNAIFAYALPTQNGVAYHHCKDDIGRLYNSDFSILITPTQRARNRYHCLEHFREANQIKYAFRQLYAETRGLVLLYNRVLFDDIEQLAAFLRSCPTHYYPHFRVLRTTKTIFHLSHLNYLSEAQATEEVVSFCRQNPHVVIQNTTPIASSSTAFLVMALQMDLIVRRGVMLLEQVISNGILRDILLRHLLRKHNIEAIAEIPGNVPSNFCIFPQLIGSEDESLQVFRDACMAEPLVMDYILPTVDGGLDCWVRVAQQILW